MKVKQILIFICNLWGLISNGNCGDTSQKYSVKLNILAPNSSSGKKPLLIDINIFPLRLLARYYFYLLIELSTLLGGRCIEKDIYNTGTVKSIFNDPDIKQQWYYIRQSPQVGLFHDLEGVWSQKINGSSVRVAIVGYGLEIGHKDLTYNYDFTISYNFINNSSRIYPSKVGSTTEFAGFISAVSNNSMCGVGAAFNSRIGILQIFDDNVKKTDDVRTARALSFRISRISIYALLWSSNYLDELEDFSAQQSVKALQHGFKHGRNYLGNVYFMSSGNRAHLGNNCGFRGYVQLLEVNVIGSILSNGSSPSFSERCAAILAAAITSPTCVATDLLYSTGVGNSCKKTACGSGVSVSIASGIVALLISNHLMLSVRQIMVAIILSSNQYDRCAVKNAAGFYYSYSFGFGMINASELIKKSKENAVENLVEQHSCSTYPFQLTGKTKKNYFREFYIYTTGCLGKKFSVTKIEQVLLVFTLSTPRRNSVRMYLISPRGTKLKVLEPRWFDMSKEGFTDWTVKLLGYYGEEPDGTWILEIQNRGYHSVLKKLQLKIYGTGPNRISNENKALYASIRHSSPTGSNVSSQTILSPFLASFVSTNGMPDGMDVNSRYTKGRDVYAKLSKFHSEIC